MLGAVLGLLSQDLAIDLGSDRTRVGVRGAGVVRDIATAVALRTTDRGQRAVIAVGDNARHMLGRTPAGLTVVRPVRAGRIVESAVADVLLEHLFTEIHGRRGIARPRVLLAEAPDATVRTRRTLHDCATAAGARAVATIPRPIAAAVGAGLDPTGPLAHMIVDLGGGTTTIAVVCRGAVIASTTLEIGGDVFDGALLRLLRREHHLLIGTDAAERLKRAAWALDPPDTVLRVAGRCLDRAVPRAVEVDSADLTRALADPLAAIGAAIRLVLERTPPEVANDVVGHGAFLCGGSAVLPGIDAALRGLTGLAMLAVDEPDRVVIDGTHRVLDDRALYAALVTPA